MGDTIVTSLSQEIRTLPTYQTHNVHPIIKDETRARRKCGHLIPHVTIWVLIYPIMILGIWAMGWTIFGPLALPGGSLFTLGVLELLALLLGHFCETLMLSPFLGMISAGFVMRNVLASQAIGWNLDPAITNPLRAISVVVLVTRGAFAVNPSLIKKHRWVLPQLCLGALAAEAIAVALSVYILTELPWQWSLCIGTMFSGMSGAGVMPYLLKIEKLGLGREHCVMEITKQGSGLDAMVAITLTEFAFGFIFANGQILLGIQKGVLEVIFGVAFGCTWGTIVAIGFQNIPASSKFPDGGNSLRTFAIFVGGCLSSLGLTRLGYPRGGPLGVFVGSFIAATFWRKKGIDGCNNDAISTNFTRIWYFMVPLLFGIVGSRVDCSTVNWPLVSIFIVCVIIGLIVRSGACYLLLWNAKEITVKDKFFIVLAWLPKGTVQAALSPVPLETALSMTLSAASAFQGIAYHILCAGAVAVTVASFIGPTMLQLFGRFLLAPRSTTKIQNIP